MLFVHPNSDFKHQFLSIHILSGFHLKIDPVLLFLILILILDIRPLNCYKEILILHLVHTSYYTVDYL